MAKTRRCERTAKRGFRSKPAALSEAFLRATTWGVTLRTYRCEFCDRWHLTSKPDRYRPQTPEESTNA